MCGCSRGGLLGGWLVVDCVAWALSLASISCPTSLIKASRFHSSSLFFRLTISLSSCGSLFIRTEVRRLPYDAEATPRFFKLRTWVSTVSYSLRRPLRWCWDVTVSRFSNSSMCRLMICCLLPKRFFKTVTASW